MCAQIVLVTALKSARVVPSIDRNKMGSFSLVLTVVLLVCQSVTGLYVGCSKIRSQWTRSVSSNNIAHSQSSRSALSGVAGIFDDEEDDNFRRIVTNYLMSKFKDCAGEDCRMFCDRKEVEELLNGLLPPVTKKELEDEVKTLMGMLGATKDDDLVDADQFLQAVVDNSYWKRAGPLVVKELIFLDALYDFYHAKRSPSTLNDEDYSDLKEMLTWEGSSTATMTGKEALFVSAVVASKKGKSVIPDDKYDSLKNELKAAGSWVVTDKTDTLSKLGMNTVLGYLFKSY